MKNKYFSSLVSGLVQRLAQVHSSPSVSQSFLRSPLPGRKKSQRHSSKVCQASRIVDFAGQVGKLMRASDWLVMLALILSISPLTSSAQNTKVVVPLGGDSLTQQQIDVLEFFTYDAANDRLTIQGTAANPLAEVRYQNTNVRGASQVRQDTTLDATDIPDNGFYVEVEEEDIVLGSPPNGAQAVLVHAYANIDSLSDVNCPCEFRSKIVQDDGLPSEVESPGNFLEVEGSDLDIDATISQTFAFIATAQSQNYSFQVRVWAQGGAPASGTYVVDEAGITLSNFGLVSGGILLAPSKGLTDTGGGSDE